MLSFKAHSPGQESLISFGCGLSIIVSGIPATAERQLYWQVNAGNGDTIKLESGGCLEDFGGILSLTTSEADPTASENQDPVGYIRWLGGDTRPSFRIGLRVSRFVFDQALDLAKNDVYPIVNLEFFDSTVIDYERSPDGRSKVWKNVAKSQVLVSEFSFGYRLSAKN